MDRLSPDQKRSVRLDGRWITVTILAGYFGLLAVLIHFYGYNQGWRFLGVPGLKPIFADLHGVLAGADSLRAGYDPLVANPADPWHRPLNYPRVWLAPSMALGLHQSQTWIVGLVLGAAFLASAFLFMGRIGPWQGAYWGVLLCAPSTMMALERGNTDLVIFVLLAVALTALRQKDARPWAAYGTVFLCAVLKLYPVCAFMLAWRETPRRAALILLAAALGFGAYLYGTREDLRIIDRGTPRALGVAYGSRVYFDWLAHEDEPDGTSSPMPALAALAAVSVALLARVRVPGPAPLPRPDADGLMVSGAMYAVTFIMNSNFNYRLVILLFAVPACWRLAGSADGFYRRLGRTLLAALAVGWLLSQMPLAEAFLVKELANWIVFVGVTFLLWQFVPLPVKLGAATGRGETGVNMPEDFRVEA